MAKDLHQDSEKKRNRIISIAVLVLLLVACGASAKKAEWQDEQDICEVQELGGYLYEHTPASPYAAAEIAIRDYVGEKLETDWDEPPAFQFVGEADVTWHFYDSLAEMETALQMAAEQEMDESLLHFLYYTFPMTENDHALDLYNDLKSRYDADGHPFAAWSADDGKLFYYLQETVGEEDGYTYYRLDHRTSKVNLYMKDRTAYGLTLLNMPSEDDETLEYVFEDVFWHYGDLWNGWGLDEEALYWVDHTERLTELTNPKRSFLEVRGIDENWESAGDEGIMRYFGLLAEADYELPLTEDGRMLSLHFSLAEDDEKELGTVSDYIEDLRKDRIISAALSLTEEDGETAADSAEGEDAELRYYLLNGHCMDEPYDMTVTDLETGEVLQERTLSLSIELPDTITYPDLNEDGYADMRVGAPVHNSGAKAVEEDYSPPSYLLWDTQEEQFVRKTEKEVENSRRAVASGLTEEEQEEKSKRERYDPFALVRALPEWAEAEDYIKIMGRGFGEYEVQEGDSLWRISERFYGTGYKWTSIVRSEDAPEDPDYLPVGETVSIPEICYIPKDLFSRGGLRSEGSFQIEQPSGFAYYFLNGDLRYVPYEQENQIHSL
ncbi:MAG: LysM peptidoglycan-binding domain-containing protein, partial [Eubacterium sp.]|nr:LysM peptidoglycan-binding domain-containing protein [Eubacterium sp.]